MTSLNKASGKVAGALLLVSVIVYEIYGQPTLSTQGNDYESVGLRAVIQELETQRLVSRMVPKAFGSGNVVIRKSVSPNDFRLRFGKRSVVPGKVYGEDTPIRQLKNWQDTLPSKHWND